MADQGKQIDPQTQQKIVTLAKTMPVTHVARRLHVSRPTVYKYANGYVGKTGGNVHREDK